jgi:hypothetical protein
MERPELIFVTGCNAAGKSSLIRSHRGELPDFVYTGEVHRNQLIMCFERERLVEYKANDLAYVQKFAEMAYHNQVLDRKELEIIAANKDFEISERIDQGKKFKI